MKICVYVNVFICFYTILYNRYYRDIFSSSFFFSFFVKKTTFVMNQQIQSNSISFYCNYKTIFLIVFLSYNKQQYFMTNLLLLNVSVKC